MFSWLCVDLSTPALHQSPPRTVCLGVWMGKVLHFSSAHVNERSPHGPIAQRESVPLTPERSLVRSQLGPPREKPRQLPREAAEAFLMPRTGVRCDTFWRTWELSPRPIRQLDNRLLTAAGDDQLSSVTNIQIPNTGRCLES